MSALAAAVYFSFAGPCVIENEEHAIRMAEIIRAWLARSEFPFIFQSQL